MGTCRQERVITWGFPKIKDASDELLIQELVDGPGLRLDPTALAGGQEKRAADERTPLAVRSVVHGHTRR
jgi:hypothetical protein